MMAPLTLLFTPLHDVKQPPVNQENCNLIAVTLQIQFYNLLKVLYQIFIRTGRQRES